MVGTAEGELLDHFQIDHAKSGLDRFFAQIERHQQSPTQPVAVAMEGYNGWARPLDTEVLDRGWQLYNVNNLKLARYKEIFPAPAKTDAMDAKRMKVGPIPPLCGSLRATGKNDKLREFLIAIIWNQRSFSVEYAPKEKRAIESLPENSRFSLRKQTLVPLRLI